MNQDERIELVCWKCGTEYGSTHPIWISTQEGTCDMCGRETAVSSASDYGIGLWFH